MTDVQILEAIRGATWSNFAMSIAQQIERGRVLSDRQRNAIMGFIEKTKKPAPTSVSIVVFTAIVEALTNARNNGVKKPIMRVQGYTFKFAPNTGRNPGSIYVTRADDDIYVGRIDSTGVFQSKGNASDWEALVKINNSPAEALRSYGKVTGVCGICGRLLTDPVSIEAGIGPICAAKWGV